MQKIFIVRKMGKKGEGMGLKGIFYKGDLKKAVGESNLDKVNK
jgi:hypothetical protein